MWASLVLAAFWVTVAALGLWLRLGIWVWSLRRFPNQDPVRLWWMSSGKHRRLPTPSEWYAEQNRRFSTPPSVTGS